MPLMQNAAGFWRRFGASLIDGILLSIIGDVLATAFGLEVTPNTIWLAGGNWIGIGLSLAYFTYFHGAKGQTAGDAAMSIRVLDIDTGVPIGFERAFVRWLMSIVSALVLTVGYLWMLWDPQKQTWHDKVARSLPIKMT
jgi:uncharacterized RDD family membrane protein YckC